MRRIVFDTYSLKYSLYMNDKHAASLVLYDKGWSVAHIVFLREGSTFPEPKLDNNGLTLYMDIKELDNIMHLLHR